MKHPDPETWWVHRRRLAYMAMLGLFGIGVAAFFMPPDQVQAATGVFSALAWMFGFVLLAYVAAATAEDLVKIRGAK